MQQVGYITLFVLSLKIGFALVIGLHLFATVFMFLMNLVNLTAYLHFIKDPVFTHWRKEDANDEDTLIIFSLSTLFSYKSMRLFYC